MAGDDEVEFDPANADSVKSLAVFFGDAIVKNTGQFVELLDADMRVIYFSSLLGWLLGQMLDALGEPATQELLDSMKRVAETKQQRTLN